MDPRSLFPWTGDREAREAWDELFSREMLGAVLIGSATGKLVENLIAAVVLLALGPDAGPHFETLGLITAWSVAIPIGVVLFAYWHRVEETAQEAVEKAAEEATDADRKD